jgi:SAM-dependent methyltransferase
MRIIDINDNSLTCDLNHAMAGYRLTVSSLVRAIYPAPEEHGGSCQDAMTQLLNGPGMQVRANGKPTDFFTDGAFERMDNTSDRAFYSMSRMTNHLDATALQQVRSLYGSLLPQHARILDLMSSISSHIPEESAPRSVTGLGMNQEELDANSQLTERLVQDLNSTPALPFDDASFDAVICTVSVEYLTDPLAVFREVNRVLKPGGIFINVFSNRWFPPKVINLWIDLHEFERMGLVSEYYLQSGNFGPVNTWSLQGLKRPADDHYAMQSPWSDPLYAVWSHKASS